MRLAVWPLEPSRALGRALASAVSGVTEAPSWQAAALLAAGEADLALVPALEVLREPDRFHLVEGVALVGDSSPDVTLVVGRALDSVRTLDFDPRYAQEALLAAVLLREHYGAQPVFAPADPNSPVADRLARHDAALVPAASATSLPAGAVALDLGREWMDLTARPFPWGLLAGRAGEGDPATDALLQAAARDAEPPAGWQFGLAGYGHAGLEEFVGHLFYHGALQDLLDLSDSGA